MAKRQTGSQEAPTKELTHPISFAQPPATWEEDQTVQADLSGVPPHRHPISLTHTEADPANSSTLPPVGQGIDLLGDERTQTSNDFDLPEPMPVASPISPSGSLSRSDGMRPAGYPGEEGYAGPSIVERDSKNLDEFIGRFRRGIEAARSGEGSEVRTRPSESTRPLAKSPAAVLESPDAFELTPRVYERLASTREQQRVGKYVLGYAGFRFNQVPHHLQVQYFEHLASICAALADDEVLRTLAQSLYLCSGGVWGSDKITSIIHAWASWVAFGDWLRDLAPLDLVKA